MRGLALVQPVDVRLDGVLVERLEAGGIGRYFGQDVRGHDLDSHLVVRVPVGPAHRKLERAGPFRLPDAAGLRAECARASLPAGRKARGFQEVP